MAGPGALWTCRLRRRSISHRRHLQRRGNADKNFLQDEIAQLLDEHGADVEAVTRVEFPWKEEIDHAPAWLGAPTPWDWIAEGTVRSVTRGQRR